MFTNLEIWNTFRKGNPAVMPIVETSEHICIDVNHDGQLCLMDEEGSIDEHLALPSEEHLKIVGDKIREILTKGTHECKVTIRKWGDIEQVI